MSQQREHCGGRPRCSVDPEDVRQFRGAGLSWRQIARRFGIGTATAMRLYNAALKVPQTPERRPKTRERGLRDEAAEETI